MKKLVIISGLVGACLSPPTQAQELDVFNDPYSKSDQTVDWTLPNILVPNLCHYDAVNIVSQAQTRTFNPGDSWTRSLKFSFEYDNTTEYDHGNQNQLDWNKLMYLGSDTWEDHVKLGWRWNVDDEQIELGLYSHINHIDNATSADVGRNFQLITAVDVETEHEAELLFGAEGLGVIVDDIGHYIKDGTMFGIGQSVTTRMRVSGYFGGQECPPHEMEVDVSNINGDNDATNWHNGACEKTYSRSTFFSFDDFTIEAARTITMCEGLYRGQFSSDPNASAFSQDIPTGYNAGEEIPFFNASDEEERFVFIEPGAEIDCMAGDAVFLNWGFHAQPGAVFRAGIDDQIACAAFSNPANKKAWTETNEDLSIEDELWNPYPNPTSTSINFNVDIPLRELILRDISGKVVWQQQNIPAGTVRIDVAEYQNGIYMLQSFSERGTTTHKVILN